MPDIEYAACGDVTLAHESFGAPEATPVLLVMGLGSQMLAWPDGFCERLADAGHRVTRFDNRDCGLSTHLDDLPGGRIHTAFWRRRAPYLMHDMALDTAGLVEHLGGSAHVVGLSMGGCISQALTLAAPERVRSLTLISTSTGSRRLGHPHPDVVRRMVTARPARDRDEAIEQSLTMWRRIGSPAYPVNEDRVRRAAGMAYDRRYDPAGGARQLAAILASPDRTEALRSVTAPTLVLHGRADPMIAVSGGRALAATIPGARLVTYRGMGHDLPESLWPDFVERIAAIVDAGETARR